MPIPDTRPDVRSCTVCEIAATGIDVISLGWLTHSAPALDVGLDFTV
jgi:nicotinate-nucleotide pyrophosphorylase (carboxylating)